MRTTVSFTVSLQTNITCCNAIYLTILTLVIISDLEDTTKLWQTKLQTSTLVTFYCTCHTKIVTNFYIFNPLCSVALVSCFYTNISWWWWEGNLYAKSKNIMSLCHSSSVPLMCLQQTLKVCMIMQQHVAQLRTSSSEWPVIQTSFGPQHDVVNVLEDCVIGT